MKKILLIILILASCLTNAQIPPRHGFGLDLNPTPELDKRVMIGEVGFLTQNITLQQLSDLITQNLDVYSTSQIDGFFTNYLAKNNLTPYTPTQATHPATVGFVEDLASGEIGTDYSIVRIGDVKIQSFKFTSNQDAAQVVSFPEAFTSKCINISVTPDILVDNSPTFNANSVTINRDDSINVDVVTYVTAIGD